MQKDFWNVALGCYKKFIQFENVKPSQKYGTIHCIALPKETVDLLPELGLKYGVRVDSPVFADYEQYKEEYKNSECGYVIELSVSKSGRMYMQLVARWAEYDECVDGTSDVLYHIDDDDFSYELLVSVLNAKMN